MYILSFFKKGDTIQGGTLFKEILNMFNEFRVLNYTVRTVNEDLGLLFS